jgi:hypothetical protein
MGRMTTDDSNVSKPTAFNAGTGAVGGGGGAGGGRGYRARRLAELEKDLAGTIRSRDDYNYRPNDLLLTVEAEGRLGRVLEELGVRPYTVGAGWRGDTDPKAQEELLRELEGSKLGLRLWQTADDGDPAEVVASLAERGESTAGLSINHVLAGEPKYAGGPADAPAPHQNGTDPSMRKADEGTPLLSVLDTGMPRSTSVLHPFVAAMSVTGAGDIDVLDADGNAYLDSEAGHGVFIAGLVEQVVPGLMLRTVRVLDSFGFGDDLTVGLGLARSDARVLNLSLGGYTQDDRPPLALLSAINALGRGVVVVAAAGNNASDRLFWPAAFKQVVAVAGYDSVLNAPASFSNFGWWVDVCAPAVNLLSTYVQGDWDNPASVFTGWATWSGTSFAAPLVAAEIAHRLSADPGRSARQVALDFLGELEDSHWNGMGARYRPAVDPTVSP